MPNRVVHFEIPVEDPERAKKFYESVFGWGIQKWEGPIPYWLVTTGEIPEPGIDGALSLKENLSTTTNTMDVSSVDEFLEKITQQGGKIITPKNGVPGVGWLAYCADTEGNVFGIMERDESAT